MDGLKIGVRAIFAAAEATNAIGAGVMAAHLAHL
jgi:hypothetical protein